MKNGRPSRAAAMAQAQWNLKAIVEELRNSREVAHNVRPLGRIRELPSRETIGNVIDGLAAALFPTHHGHSDLTDESIDFFVGETLNTALTLLSEQVRRGLLFGDGKHEAKHDPGAAPLAAQAIEIVRAFASQLPSLRALLVSDLQAAYKGDPAATSISEILLCYPGVAAVMNYRFAHALHRLGALLIPRLVTEIAHSRTGIDIHPGAEIGPSFFIDHGTGVVIGETTIIGQHVRLYQAVTLGAKRFEVDADGALLKGGPRHPIVEDDVVIYAGATILGRITIGRGSTIGGNVWLTQNVPPGSNITQAQMRRD
ncbi:MAG TPA: serine O-acetyltransferase EpsC [Burkholderiaceae bacterium]